MGLFGFLNKKEDAPQSDGPLYVYTEQETTEYEAYIRQHFEEYTQVLHEIVSPDIHLDILYLPPTEAHPFYKLITMGAGAYKMGVPAELAADRLDYAEYIIYLPKDWTFPSADEKDYWPVRALKVIARLPIVTNSWLGPGHTVQANADGSPYAENTELHSTLLIPALDLEKGHLDLTLSTGKKINFYQLVPIYREELELIGQLGAGAVVALLDQDAEMFPVLDASRRNIGKPDAGAQ